MENVALPTSSWFHRSSPQNCDVGSSKVFMLGVNKELSEPGLPYHRIDPLQWAMDQIEKTFIGNNTLLCDSSHTIEIKAISTKW